MKPVFSLFALIAISATCLPIGATAEPIQQPASGRCLDSDSDRVEAGVPAPVYTSECNSTQYQDWVFDGETIRNSHSGRCLDSSAWNRGDDTPGDVYALECNGTAFQKWEYGFGSDSKNFSGKLATFWRKNEWTCALA
jgi:hypothetical protein